jgi:hypothetical protein
MGGGERAPKELRHAVRAGNLEVVKKHVVDGKYTDAISNPKVGSTILFASAQVSERKKRSASVCAGEIVCACSAGARSHTHACALHLAVRARQGGQAPARRRRGCQHLDQVGRVRSVHRLLPGACGSTATRRMPRPHRLRRDALLTTAVATAQGHTDVIELLLEHKADVNRAKSDGATPLFAAAQQ